MSDGNEFLVSRGPAANSAGETPSTAGRAPGADRGGSDAGGSSLDTAKNEATEVTQTATDAAKEVGELAKDEAGSVMGEAKDQLQGLYEQTRSELTEEATKQQERIATGLQTVGDDLESMARSSEDGGLARELVRETSQRVGRVATWLNEREPGAVLDEVKAFARRQPGVFIGAAAIAGVVAGRLTRALAANASDSGDGANSAGASRRVTPAATRSAQPATPSTPGAAGTAVGESAGAHAAGEALPGTVRAPLEDTDVAPRRGTGMNPGTSANPGLGTNPGAPINPGLQPNETREGDTDERPHTL